MAKETKEDRIVRNMISATTEELHELYRLFNSPDVKEMEIERWVQGFLKTSLGYTASAGYSVKPQESKGRSRPDLIVCKNDKPVFVIEVKNAKFDLNKSDFRSGKTQLSEYLHNIGDVKWGILTNGIEWKLYDFSQQKQKNGLVVLEFDFLTEIDDKVLNKKIETIDLTKKVIENQCYDLIDFHETSFVSDYWSELSQEALVFSPELLAKAILSSDVVKHITKQIRGEHEYKACQELVTEKVYELLAQGLDDSINGWNQAKSDEFKKYVQSQKRAARKTKKTKKVEAIVVADQHVPVVAAAAAAEPVMAVAPAQNATVKAS